MDNQPSTLTKKSKLSAQDILNDLLICLMMVCFSVVVVTAVHSVLPAWNGSYLVALALLVAAEALASNKLNKDSTLLNSNPLVSRITEWVVILILVKLLKYLFTNPATFFSDIHLWQHDFGSFFLHDDYLVICIFLFFNWVLSTLFSNCLFALEEDYALYELERQGNAKTNRADARRGLMGLVFGIGFVMLFFTTLSNISTVSFIVPNPDLIPIQIALILLFFLMGFSILAQSQYSILRARWYIESIPVNRVVSTRWISFSILLAIFVAILVIWLPTRYTVGLFDLVRSALVVLFAIFTFLELICFAPLGAFFALLARLFGQGSPPPGSAVQIPTPAPTPPPLPPAATSSWIEVLKSILFWAIFLVVIFFAFRQYLSQRQGLIDGLRRFPLWSWVKRSFNWFAAQFHLVNRQISAFLDASATRLRGLIKTNPIHFDPLLTISSRLPPRQRILLIYLSMIHWNNRNGFPRKGNQTPFEYAHSLNNSLPEGKLDLDAITNAFIEARYTRHSLTHEQANQVQTTLEHLQTVFRENLERKQQIQDGK